MTIALLALAGQLGIYLATLITTRRRQEQLWNDAKLIRDCQAFKAATGWGTPNSVGATVGDLIRENKDYSARLITYGATMKDAEEEIKELQEEVNRLTQEAKATQYFRDSAAEMLSVDGGIGGGGGNGSIDHEKMLGTYLPGWSTYYDGAPVTFSVNEVYINGGTGTLEDGVFEVNPGCPGEFKVRLPQPLTKGRSIKADLTRWKRTDPISSVVGRVLEDSDENNVTLCRFF